MRRFAAFLASATILFGCPSKESPSTSTSTSTSTSPSTSPSTSTPTPPSTYRARSVPDGHSLEVRVLYAGARRTSNWDLPAAMNAHCGASDVPNESLDVTGGTNVNGAVAWLDDIHEGEPPPTADVVQDEKRCVFIPHVLATAVPSRLKLTNGDPANHAVRMEILGGSMPDEVTRTIPPGGSVFIDAKPEWAGRIAKVTCPIHLWMFSSIHFFDHPYFAVTRAGVAKIDRIPPGTYHLTVWHEALDARFDKTLTASSPKTIRVEVTIGNGDAKRTFALADDGTLTAK
jgi:hypothetical protein